MSDKGPDEDPSRQDPAPSHPGRPDGDGTAAARIPVRSSAPEAPRPDGERAGHKRQLLVVLAMAVVLAVLAGVVIVRAALTEPGGLPKGATQAATVRIAPQLKGVTSVWVAGSAYDVHDGVAQVRVAADTGGLVLAYDRGRALMGIGPVWSLGHHQVSLPELGCESTAFSRLLLTPGIADSDPLTLDLLWHTARPHLGALTGELCRNLTASGSLPAPTSREQQLTGELFSRVCGTVGGIADLVRAVPNRHCSGNGPAGRAAPAWATRSPAVRAGSGLPGAPGGSAERAGAAAAECGSGRLREAAGTSPSVALCEQRGSLTVRNSGPVWSYIYPAGGPLEKPIGAVRGVSPDVPDVKKIITAIIDATKEGLATLCRKILGVFGITLDACRSRSTDRNPFRRFTRFLDPGRAILKAPDGKAGHGYYAVAWGDRKDGLASAARSAFPRDLTDGRLKTVEGHSRALTYISDLVLPTLALAGSFTATIDTSGLVNNPNVDALLTRVARDLPADSDRGGTLAAMWNLLKDRELVGLLLRRLTPRSVNLDALNSSRLGDVLVTLASQGGSLAAVIIKAVGVTARGVELLLSIDQITRAGQLPGYASWPGAFGRDEAFRLRGRDLPEGCDQAHPAVRPESSATAPQCLWDVSADLDGDRRPDRLVLWSGPQGRGAQAYLARGDDSGLTIPAAQELGKDGERWGGATDPFTVRADPLTLLHLDGSSRTQVLVSVRDEPDGRTSKAVIALGGDGRLHLVTGSGDGQSGVTLFTGSQVSVGCATRGGRRYFVTTSLYQAPSPTRPGPGTAAYGISRFVYEIGPGPVLVPVGYQGSAALGRQGASGYSNDCGTGTTPLTEAPRRWAGSAENAITGLLGAAQNRDQTAAPTFIGGDLGTFISGTDPEHFYQPDVWAYLTAPANQGLLAAAQGRRPVAVGLQRRIAGRYARYRIATSAGDLWFAVAWNGPAPVVTGVWTSAVR